MSKVETQTKAKKRSKKEESKQTSIFDAFNSSLLATSSDGFVKNLIFSNAGTKKYELYEVIDEGLTFPSTFQKFNIQGAVIAKLYFNKKGKFILSNSLFNSKNGFLRFHVMSYLERKLKDFELGDEFDEGFVEAHFIFKFKASGLQMKKTFGQDQFVFERVGFKAATKVSQAILEVGQTLISLLNLLKFRPDFLKTNTELAREQQALHYLQKIRQHPYYR